MQTQSLVQLCPRDLQCALKTHHSVQLPTVFKTDGSYWYATVDDDYHLRAMWMVGVHNKTRTMEKQFASFQALWDDIIARYRQRETTGYNRRQRCITDSPYTDQPCEYPCVLVPVLGGVRLCVWRIPETRSADIFYLDEDAGQWRPLDRYTNIRPLRDELNRLSEQCPDVVWLGEMHRGAGLALDELLDHEANHVRHSGLYLYDFVYASEESPSYADRVRLITRDITTLVSRCKYVNVIPAVEVRNEREDRFHRRIFSGSNFPSVRCTPVAPTQDSS